MENVREVEELFGAEFLSDHEDMLDQGDEEEDDDEAHQVDLGSLKRHKSVRDDKDIVSGMYEPAVLQESHLGEKDDFIRGTDIPERLQQHITDVRDAQDKYARLFGTAEDEQMSEQERESERAREAEWITAKLQADYARDFARDQAARSHHATVNGQQMQGEPLRDVRYYPAKAVRDAVVQFLNLVHTHHMEVPYIATYEKDMWQQPAPEGSDQMSTDKVLNTKTLWCMERGASQRLRQDLAIRVVRPHR